jgi:2-polyprenyl-6-methoxyphenol hydroxylase-like FAD-dependent oxidoreductase
MSLPRSELAGAIYREVADSVDTIFGDEIAAVDDDEHEVRVRFQYATPRSFDLVIGADGLHSKVRNLAFGPQSDFETYLGYKVAAAQLEGYGPRDELAYLLYSPVGLQVGRFSMRGDRTLALFVWADPDAGLPTTVEAQRAVLASRFREQGWECQPLIDALDPVSELYYDRVSQIRMPRWTQGRIALVGDAAFCVSLIAGQGSALAMVAAYVLAGELKNAGGNHRAAFDGYERLLSGFIAGKQKAAERFASSFVPRSAVSASVRNQVTKLFRFPWVTRLAFGRSMIDKLKLPTY